MPEKADILRAGVGTLRRLKWPKAGQKDPFQTVKAALERTSEVECKVLSHYPRISMAPQP